MTSLAASAVAAIVLLTPASISPCARKRRRRRCRTAKAEAPKPKPPNRLRPRLPAARSGNVAADRSGQSGAQKSLTTKAIDKVKEVAKSAGDIFSRVPCLSPKGGAKTMGSLPHVASKLAAGEPVVIIAFGSSSTAGYRLDRRRNSTIPTGCAAQLQPAISDRRHHRAQSRQGRRGRARNDEAAADRSDRHESGSGDLAGRHQRGAAQPRSGGDRQAGRGRRRAHPGRRQPIVVLVDPQYSPRGQRARRKRQQDDQAARTRSPNCARSASSRASR